MGNGSAIRNGGQIVIPFIGVGIRRRWCVVGGDVGFIAFIPAICSMLAEMLISSGRGSGFALFSLSKLLSFEPGLLSGQLSRLSQMPVADTSSND